MSGLLLFMADPWIDLEVANADPEVAAHWLLTTDRSLYAAADVLVYPVPLWGAKPPVERAHPRQVQVLWSQESAVHYPRLLDTRSTSHFDLRMTYQLDSDVPIPYLSSDIFDQLPPVPSAVARNDVAVSAWVSSRWDRCHRDRYLLELMGHIPVHSYGRVGHNWDLPDDRGTSSKLATIGSYRFTIAFENSIATDYVTEKFFQPLLAGSVPIYRGAPNIAQFAPSPHSYIDADDFSGPSELADFLRSLSDEQYLRYHDWRAHGPTAEWRERFAQFSTSSFARLAKAVRVVQIGLSALAARR